MPPTPADIATKTPIDARSHDGEAVGTGRAAAGRRRRAAAGQAASA
ncbi:MAG: hypothetical protein MZW92_55130 [Comamonadaceae bacterium]|nr:hypothetical protein [Comamonadaceae bacterium]